MDDCSHVTSHTSSLAGAAEEHCEDAEHDLLPWPRCPPELRAGCCPCTHGHSAKGSSEQMLLLVYSSVSVLMFLYSTACGPAGLLMERKYSAPLLFAFFSWCLAAVAREGLQPPPAGSCSPAIAQR